MRFYKPQNLRTILESLGPQECLIRVVGNPDKEVLGLDDYQVALPQDITWVDYEPFYDRVFKSAATVVIINEEPKSYPKDKTLLVTPAPKELFDLIMGRWIQSRRPPQSFLSRLFNPRDIHIGKGCKIDKSVRIGSHVWIGDNVTLDPYVYIHDYVTIGDNVIVRSHCSIGGEPFSHTKLPDGTYEVRKAWGDTVLLDNVVLAPFTNVDRGITGSTILGPGTKTCAICQIGHDTWIGKNGYICSGVTIAGYVRIGNDCQFWGQAAVNSSIHIADDTRVDSCGIVLKDIKESGTTVGGFPAEPSQRFWKREALLRRIAADYENGSR